MNSSCRGGEVKSNDKGTNLLKKNKGMRSRRCIVVEFSIFRSDNYCLMISKHNFMAILS
jgi:hypothetical protein